jgi:tRNA(Ile2) C34 agmatinyltransferase TiaS
MRSLRELLHRAPSKETACPRCGVLASAGDVKCTACGWDLREGYHDPLKGAGEGTVARDRDM